MSEAHQYTSVWDGISNSYASDRLAHAYLIVGSSRGQGLSLAKDFLKLLFCKQAEPFCRACPACRQIEEQEHPDAFWIEPRSKSRQIKADEVRELIHRMGQTSFEGGWKAGVILAADRMNPNSQNALLKTLEEPPAKSVLLLVTDAPQKLLPTIVSRCQKLVLSDEGLDALDSLWHEPLMQVLCEMPPRSGLGAVGLAGRVNGILGALEAALTEEEKVLLPEELTGKVKEELLDGRVRSRLLEIRHEIVSTMLNWQRDVLAIAGGASADDLVTSGFEDEILRQAELFTPISAVKAVQQVETMASQLERIARRDQFVLEATFRKMVVRR